MKKTISLLLCVALLTGLFGCVGPARASNSNAAKAASGRYMEQVINVPLPEGVSEQYIIGLSALDNGIEVFSNAYVDNGDGTADARYYRHTILDDGTTTTVDEPWLNDLAKDGGNELRVIRAADGALNLYLNVMERPAVYPKVIEKHVMAELPFMATENIIMACVKRGGDRQELHEVIRVHSHAAAAQVKEHGKDNDLIERLAADPVIGMTRAEIEATLDVRLFIGRAPEQTVEFAAEYVDPVLERNAARLGATSDVRV